MEGLHTRRNFAYIDGANLHKGIQSLGWNIDYYRFRIWLREKYSVERAYLFLGFVPKYKKLYKYLKDAGFDLIFKETVRDNHSQVKGNCDADLVLETVRGAYEDRYDKAVIVSNDGDYARLIKFLLEKHKLEILLSPSKKCSVLLYRTGAPITFLHRMRSRIAKKEKAPATDGTVEGSLSW